MKIKVLRVFIILILAVLMSPVMVHSSEEVAVPAQCAFSEKQNLEISGEGNVSETAIEFYSFNCSGYGLFEVNLDQKQRDLFLSWTPECKNGSRSLVGNAPTKLQFYLCKREWASKLQKSGLMTIRFFDL